MFDIGLPEMLVVIVITLLVVGPKDLPKVIRGFARTIARLRRMVDEFMVSVNQYVRESELAELKDTVDKARKSVDVRSHVKDMIDPHGDLDKPIIPPDDASDKSAPKSSPDPTIHDPGIATNDPDKKADS